MTEGSNDGRDGRQVRWNLGALMMDVTFFSLGSAFMDPSAVLPLLLERLGAGGPLIGLVAALRFLCFTLFQMFVAYALHGKPRQKPWLAVTATLTRLPLLLLPWFLWRSMESEAARLQALGMTILLISLWSLGDGLGYVPWMEIVARAFSDRTRGRFFASTQLASGLISILVAAFVVRELLRSPRLAFPHNYALLAGICALLIQISLIGVLLIREPRAPASLSTTPMPPLSAYFRRLPSLMRQNPTFMLLALIQLLIGFGSAAAPFYVLYATRKFRLSDDWGGIYQMLQAIGVVALMPLWTLLSEKRSPAAAVRAVALACLLTPLVALSVGALNPWIFGLVFLLMGGSLGWGMWIVLNQFLLTHISEDERPIFVALMNLLFAPSAIYPFLGGLLAQQGQFATLFGMPLLFLLTALIVALGGLLSLRLGSANPSGHPLPAPGK